MERDRILTILRAHQAELQAAGLLHLRLFGSVARGDNTPASDVDLLVDYDESSTGKLLHAYGMQEDITQILGVPAHLSSSKHIRPEIKGRVLPEIIRVY